VRDAARAAPDWDALAPVWHCLETAGLDLAALRAVLPALTAPVLYAGGGRGVYPARLGGWLAPGRVAVVDSSPAMARRARRDFGLTYACADVRALPYPAGAFGSAVCATGVLEHLDDAGRGAALRELRRVTAPGGAVVLAVFDAASTGRSALAAWRDGAAPRRVSLAFGAVARTVGGRAAAFRLLSDALPPGAGRPVDAGRLAAASGLEATPVHVRRGVTVWRVQAPVR
jgi:SAM-dependent methyltransferase